MGKNKKKPKKSNFSKQKPKIRIPIPRPGTSFKSKKDYRRKENRKVVDKEIYDNE